MSKGITSYTYYHGIPLSRKDLQGINGVRLVVNSVDLDDRQGMAINRERKVRIARYSDKAKTVAVTYVRSCYAGS
jgi:hypothetical protein